MMPNGNHQPNIIGIFGLDEWVGHYSENDTKLMEAVNGFDLKFRKAVYFRDPIRLNEVYKSAVQFSEAKNEHCTCTCNR